MSAILAYLITITVALLVGITDWLLGGRGTDGLFSGSSFNIAAGIAVLYVAMWITIRTTTHRSRRSPERGPWRWRSMLLDLDREIGTDDGWWPLALAGCVLVLSIVSLPVVAFELISPVSWVLFALLAAVAIGIYTDRTVSAVPARVVPRGVTFRETAPSPNNVLDHLRGSMSNLAELQAVASFPARAATTTSVASGHRRARSLQPGGLLYSACASLGMRDTARLYSHQHALLHWLLADRDRDETLNHVVLTTGPGSGRRTAIFLAALDRVLSGSAHVLIVTPDESSLNSEVRRFQEIAERAEWDYALSIGVIQRDEDVVVAEVPPDILFCSLETLHHVLLPRNNDWSEFFDALDLVVAYDVECYTGIFGANAAQVFRRLANVARLHQQRLQIIATARPGQTLDTFASRLFHLAPPRDVVRIISSDGSPRAEQIHAIWLPTLDASHAHVNPIHARRLVTETVVELAAKILDTSPDYRLHIHCDEAESVDIHMLEQQIISRARRPLSRTSLTITTTESELGRRQREIDAFLLLGMPRTPTEIQQLAGPLGADRGRALVITLTQHSPAALHLVDDLRKRTKGVSNGNQAADTVEDGVILLPLAADHLDVVAKHLRYAILEAPMAAAEIAELFGDSGTRIADQWVVDGIAEYVAQFVPATSPGHPNDVLRLVEPMSGHASKRLSLHTIADHDLISIDTAIGEEVLLVDRHREAIEIYPYREIHRGRQRFILVPAPGAAASNYGATLLHPGDDITTKPRYRITAVAADLRSAELLPRADEAAGNGIQIWRGQIEIVQTLVAVDKLDVRRPGVAGVIEPLARQIESTYLADAILVSAHTETGSWPIEVAWSLAHALQIVLRHKLPAAYPLSELQIAVLAGTEATTQATTIAIFDTVDRGAGLADTLADHTYLLLHEAYRTLASCPCPEGCSACLEAVPLNQIIGDPAIPLLDKRTTLDVLRPALCPEPIFAANKTAEEPSSQLQPVVVSEQVDSDAGSRRPA